MPENSNNRTLKKKRSERRAGPRYRLSAPPKIGMFQTDTGTLIQVHLVDLSQGGCQVEAEAVLPLGTEVTVMLEKGSNHVRAQARVVRASPSQILAVAFTSMEGDGFRILDEWLSTFITTTWVATNRRKSQRAAIHIEVSISGYNPRGVRFTEDAETVEISAIGGSVVLRAEVQKGQMLVLSNPKTKVEVECLVANIEARGADKLVGLAFKVPNQPFWPINFPPAGWSHSDPYAKRYGS
jgi:hypothetical protein